MNLKANKFHVRLVRTDGPQTDKTQDKFRKEIEHFLIKCFNVKRARSITEITIYKRCYQRNWKH